MPGDIGGLLTHTIPEINGVAVSGAPSPLTLDNLNQLNGSVSLTSKEGIEALPSWMDGVTPDGNRTEGATSCTIITVDKGSGILDAFYFYFYDYNRGDFVLGLEFGDHVGDWEHNMVRFENGVPTAVWFSQHSDGQAFTYGAVEKTGVTGLRPVVYVANGTHANYGTSGTHDRSVIGITLPGTLAADYCDAGTLWDPMLSAFAYSYDVANNTFTPYAGTESVNWLYFQGQWGDAQLPAGTPGQVVIFGEAKYVAGPTGPITKNLGRTAVCEVETGCTISSVLTAK